MKIAELLKAPEDKILEFKQDLSSSQNLLKTLVAFANTAGGRVVVGVQDKTRKPIGVENPLDEEERLCNLIADSIAPRLVPNIELTTVEGKTLLVIEVFLSNSRPHYLRSQGPEAGVYVRLGFTNRQADRELIAELRRSVEGVSYDAMPMPELSVNDLDLDGIRRTFRGIRDIDEQALLTLKLLVRDQGKTAPSRGGMLLFGRNRTFHFPDCWVQCGRFIGRDKARIFDHIEIEEPLPQAVDSIMLFLKKHAMRGADFSDIRRKDVWSIPLASLREAIINALVHADWSQRGAPIRVAFFDDRIEIENPGILLPGLTVDDMKQGVSRIRNPVIARVFRELNLIEQWGSGVPRIFRETAAAGFPEPYIRELGLRVRFVFPLAKSIHLQEPAQPGARSGARSRAQSEAILQVLSDTPLSASEIAVVLGLGSKTGAFKRSIKELLAQGLIEYTIPEKPASRLQKYQLTKRGSRVLQGSPGKRKGR